ncbi:MULTISPECIES: L,D-transpeptidase family protein [Capnocytophaga]|jgi:putative peptidoglycan binding domain protein|uniref:L,D-transpeptidase family protein n=1 Tax=Capnocytophaga sputigena TaxID=1019 RepID=UPI00288B6B07|nr:L,D-transpeptidase family protein [Capnocytophaga sputigena]
MKIKFYFLIATLAILQSCKKNPASHPDSSLRENGEEIYTEALTIAVDTTAATFENLPILDTHYKKGIQSETYTYYIQNGGKTRWLYQDIPSRLFKEYLSVLDSVANDGLVPETYRRTALKKAVDSSYAHQLSDDYKASLDKEITASFLLFTKHLTSGRFTRITYGKHTWRKPKYDAQKNINLLLNIGDKTSLASVIIPLFPHNKQYEQMKALYKQLKQQVVDTFITVDFPAKDFVYGYTAPIVVQLRNSLKQKGFEAAPEIEAQMVDSTLIRTVQRFQKSNGLTANGLLGKQTLYFLNMNKTRERDLLQLNMERMRVFNNDLGEHYALVNIPDFKLSLFHKDSLQFQTRVVVGRTETSTPIFTDTIRYVEFRPTWSVPQSIIKKEMLPQIISQADPEKYQKRGYTMYEKGKKVDPTTIDWTDPSVHKRGFHFVEAPSANNSLGLVKFILTNDMSIYLHDTPSKYFFQRDDRALSHGCVRVQNPNELAYHLLKNEATETPWTLEKVNEAMNGKRSQYRIALKTKYKINILYYTAFIDENGELTLKNDIYDLDNEQLKEIKRFES